MTPKEVGSLQAVAKAHGGSLTINPHTGLAEAGFLKGLLPTLLGAGLAATGVGAPMAALMVGGGYAAASGGDLKKGLMAGLGAYGGAGMYGAVNPATAVPTPTPTVPTNTLGTGTYPTAPDLTTSVTTGQPLGAPAAPAPTPLGAPTPAPANTLLGAPRGMPIEDAVMSKYGAASLGSTVAGSKEEPKAPTPADPGMIRPYTFERTRNEDAFKNTTSGAPLSSREQRYFNDAYTAQTPYKAPGPEYMAAGGPVEQMSNNATIGANTMYPMANMTTSAFATPYQDPRSTNMMAAMAPSGGGTVDAMSGEPNMQGTRLATGGEIEFRGHFNANSQNGGQGNGDNGYQSAGGGGDSSGILGKFQGQAGGGYQGNDPSPGYQQMQQMNQPQGFGPRGPATFDQDYLNTMASLRGQPAAPYAPPNIMQGATFAKGGEVQRFGLGGMSIDSTFDPQNAPEGGIGSLIRTAMAGRQKQGSNPRQYTYDPQSQQYTEIQQGTPVPAYAIGGSLGGYSDGGRMLKGPGDGMSDNIPATIGNKQPARLADGEFVVPADVVSHLGNGSTDAGAKQLYAMMDKIRAARTGTKKQGKQINPRKYMPA